MTTVFVEQLLAKPMGLLKNVLVVTLRCYSVVKSSASPPTRPRNLLSQVFDSYEGNIYLFNLRQPCLPPGCKDSPPASSVRPPPETSPPVDLPSLPEFLLQEPDSLTVGDTLLLAHYI